MKVLVTGTLFLLFAFKFVKNESLNVENGVKYHKNAIYAEMLSDALKALRWDQQEKPCLDTMMSILDNAKNFTLWAVWVLDSIQPPTGHLYGRKYHIGSYDECLKPHYGFKVGPNTPKTQFCVAEVSLTETDDWVIPADYIWLEHNVTTDIYLKKPTKHGRVMSNLVWGICVPEVCAPTAVSKIARSLLQISHLGVLSESAGINVTHCENQDALNKDSTGTTILKRLVLFLAAVAIFCTYCVKSGKVNTGTFVGELANSFNLSRNMATLTKVLPDEVYSMNLIRVLTSFYIVNIHYVMFTYIQLIANGLDQEPTMDEQEETSSHVDIVVDTFLTLSGVLFVRGLFSDKAQNPLKYIWKRYVRLIPVMAALILYMAIGHTAVGPIWHQTGDIEAAICRENWLINLLMMGNIYVDKMCAIASWYVPCDYQLCIFTTILYVIYKKNETVGKYAFAGAFVAAVITPGLVTYANGFAPLVFRGVESMISGRLTPGFKDFYVKSYCRAGPFLVGAMMGYLMYTYKPKDYRKVIGTISSYLGLVFGLVLMYQVMAIGHHLYHHEGALATAIYAAYNRTLWGLAICIIVGVSEYGNLPILNSAFSWYPLVPLSKLTYGVYFFHYPILERIFCSMRTTFEFDNLTMAVGSAGTALYALAASLVIWLLFEAPIININNMLLNNTWMGKTKESIQPKNNTVHVEKKLK